MDFGYLKLSQKNLRNILKNNLVEDFNIETPHSDNLNKAFVEKLKEFYKKNFTIFRTRT